MRYPRDVLATQAASCGSLVELMEHIGAPLSKAAKRYVEQRLHHYGIDVGHFNPCELPARSPVLYTREALTEAVDGARSLREVGIRLGLPDGDIPYSHIRTRMERFGIDTSHLSRTAPPEPFLPPVEVGEAVARSRSVAEALRLLGQKVSTGTRARLKAMCEEHAISTDHFLGQASRKGVPSPRKPTSELLVVKPPESGRTSGELLRRALDGIGRPRSCAECGLGEEWQGGTLVLELDHVNGNWRDNQAENLRYLCPSCHSQTATFAGRCRS